MSRALRGVAAAAGLLAATMAAAAPPAPNWKGDWRNVTAGGPLRPGVYGRIAVRGPAPPVIYEQPLLANPSLSGPKPRPVYLYVPPGQVRKWKESCAKWSACEEAVLFVRVDDSPSRWGEWRQLREQFALHGRQ